MVILVGKVYKDFRQFEDTGSLTEAIGLVWNDIDVELPRKFARSMPRRCTKVIEKRVGRTHYQFNEQSLKSI